MVKVCLVQFKVLNNPFKNLSRIELFFKKALGCDFICFPECFLTGPESKSTFNEKIPGLAKNLFSKLSKKYKIYSIMGSIHERKSSKLTNISYLFNRKGQIVGSYEKISLVPRTEEIRDIAPGNKYPVFNTEFGKVAIQICRDLFYPEITKSLAKKGSKIIFSPAFWAYSSKDYLEEMRSKYKFNTEARVVDSLVPSRSMENNIVFIFVNAAGDYSNTTIDCFDKLLGHTQIALPFYGKVKALKNRKEGIIIYNANFSVLNDAKKAYRL